MSTTTHTDTKTTTTAPEMRYVAYPTDIPERRAYFPTKRAAELMITELHNGTVDRMRYHNMAYKTQIEYEPTQWEEKDGKCTIGIHINHHYPYNYRRFHGWVIEEIPLTVKNTVKKESGKKIERIVVSRLNAEDAKKPEQSEPQYDPHAPKIGKRIMRRIQKLVWDRLFTMSDPYQYPNRHFRNMLHSMGNKVADAFWRYTVYHINTDRDSVDMFFDFLGIKEMDTVDEDLTVREDFRAKLVKPMKYRELRVKYNCIDQTIADTMKELFEKIRQKLIDDGYPVYPNIRP